MSGELATGDITMFVKWSVRRRLPAWRQRMLRRLKYRNVRMVFDDAAPRHIIRFDAAAWDGTPFWTEYSGYDVALEAS